MTDETMQGSGSAVAATNGPGAEGVQPDASIQNAESAPAQPEQRPASDTDPVQKKINKLTYQRRRAEQERDYWRQKAEGGTRAESRQASTDDTETALKTLADFDYDEQRFNKYMFDEVGKRMEKSLETKLEKQFSQRETQAQQRQRLAKFATSEREFSKKTPDYFDVTRDESLPFTQTVSDLLATSDMGPELTYHLAKNPDLLFEIVEMDERAAARRLGRLEERLESARKAPPGRSVTRAPAPAAKLDATDEVLEKTESEMSDSEWLARRRKQVHSRGL